jgi:hypothetical protein
MPLVSAPVLHAKRNSDSSFTSDDLTKLLPRRRSSSSASDIVRSRSPMLGQLKQGGTIGDFRRHSTSSSDAFDLEVIPVRFGKVQKLIRKFESMPDVFVASSTSDSEMSNADFPVIQRSFSKSHSKSVEAMDASSDSELEDKRSPRKRVVPKGPAYQRFNSIPLTPTEQKTSPRFNAPTEQMNFQQANSRRSSTSSVSTQTGPDPGEDPKQRKISVSSSSSSSSEEDQVDAVRRMMLASQQGKRPGSQVPRPSPKVIGKGQGRQVQSLSLGSSSEDEQLRNRQLPSPNQAGKINYNYQPVYYRKRGPTRSISTQTEKDVLRALSTEHW